MSTETEVIQVIKEAACKQDVELSHNLEDDLGFDSIDLVELVMMLEETFDIEITDEHALEVRTVKDVVERISELVHRI